MKKNVRFVLFISIFLCTLSVWGQKNYIRFEHISLEEGLSQATVYGITQDINGFMWFATEDGLNKYNGYDFKTYYFDPNNPKALPYKRIFDLFVDKKGNLWVGTLGGGISKYNVETDDFTTYSNDPNNPASLSSDIIQSIFEDKEGNLWVGTAYGGLCLMDREKGTFRSWMNNPQDPNSPSNDVIRGISQDSEGLLWLATNGGGLNSFNFKTNTFTRYMHSPADAESIADNELNGVYCDLDGNIWTATGKGGISILDKKTGKFRQIKNIASDPSSLPNNQVMKIFEDSNNDIWIATFGGLARLAPQNRDSFKFINYYYSPYEPFSISNNYIRAIYEDRQGILWFGTYQDGVNKYVRGNKKIVQYKNHINDANSLIENNVRAFAEDFSGNIWVGCNSGGLDQFDPQSEVFNHIQIKELNEAINCIVVDSAQNLWLGLAGGGLIRYNPKTKATKHFLSNENDINSISGNYIKAMILDSDNHIWIATSGNGLNKYDHTTQKFTRYQSIKNDTTTLAEDRLMWLTKDKNGRIWIGYANKGIDIFDKNKGVIKQFRYILKDSTTISNNRIHVIYESKNSAKNYIWVGTGGGGINKIDPETFKIQFYTIRDGLPSDIIYGILEDKSGNLWLSTNYGISRLNPNANSREEMFKKFDMADGLQGNAFSEGAFLKSADGAMYFGGVNGFNSFYPHEIANNSYIPPIYITDFKLFNQKVDISENSVLNKNIILTHDIILSHTDYIFSFEFAALNYLNPSKNKYKCMMEGFDKTWTEYSGNRRFVTYTNLPAGEYTFKVRASNNDGIWNEQTSEIKIIITPPFYKTTIFYVLVVFTFLGLFYFFVQYRTGQLKKTKLILERKVRQRTAEIRQQKEEILAQAEQLEASNKELEKLSIVASETDNAVGIFSANGDLEWVNAGFTRMYGYTCEEYIMQVASNILKNSSNQNINELIQVCINEKKSIQYESPNTTKDGRQIWVQTALTPIIDSSNNQLIKLIALDTDITAIKQAEREILQKNEEIMSQKDILLRQNEDIRGSIRYAQTIQQAILPAKNVMDKYFNSFIIYLPKDIVSGDFYWFSEYTDRTTNTQMAFLAAVDCTGHGVPGAFMSLIGNRLLNEIVNEQKVTNPAQILEILSVKVVTALRQSTSDNNDGMDVALCAFRKMPTGQTAITFAGAKRPLYFMNKQTAEIHTIKGTSRTIGGIRNRKSNEFPFANNELLLNPGDSIYISTDGIIDQNNVDRKRFGTERLMDVLKRIATHDVETQKEEILLALNKHQGDELQRDDITFIGVQVI